MWPSIRDSIVRFFTDKTYFASKWDRWVAKVRSLIMALGAALAVYGDQITASLPPSMAGRAKLAGVVLMALSLMLRAGDKTPQEVKDMAAQLKAQS